MTSPEKERALRLNGKVAVITGAGQGNYAFWEWDPFLIILILVTSIKELGKLLPCSL